MALRTFVDSAGIEWKVWDVIPSWIREHEEETPQDSGFAVFARKPGMDRSTLLTAGLEQGWLCFESETEKRRLTPIPPQWAETTDRELEALCGEASARPRIT